MHEKLIKRRLDSLTLTFIVILSGISGVVGAAMDDFGTVENGTGETTVENDPLQPSSYYPLYLYPSSIHIDALNGEVVGGDIKNLESVDGVTFDFGKRYILVDFYFPEPNNCISTFSIRASDTKDDTDIKCRVYISDSKAEYMSTTIIDIEQGKTKTITPSSLTYQARIGDLVLSKTWDGRVDHIAIWADRFVVHTLKIDAIIANRVLWNEPPKFSDVSISVVGGGTAYKDSTFQCTYTISDPDSTSHTVEYQWQKIVSGNWQDVPNQVGYLTILKLNSFQPNDIIRCTVRASDGIDWSAWSGSNQITIAAHPPTIQCTPPTQIYRTTTQEMTWTASGVDVSGGSYSVIWDYEGFFPDWTYASGSWDGVTRTYSISLANMSNYVCTISIIITLNNGYGGQAKQHYHIAVVAEPPLTWSTPSDEEQILFGKGDAELSISYESSGYDRVNLFLKGTKVYTSTETGPVTATILLDYTGLGLDGNVSAELRGYKGEFVKIISRGFTFGKVKSDNTEIIDSGSQTMGEQLYLILHDPNGDNSFSGFEQTSKVSMGFVLKQTDTTTIGLKIGAEVGSDGGLFGKGSNALNGISCSQSNDEIYDFMMDVTDTTSLTSGLVSDDKNFIGPGYGDRYWGEAWYMQWQLKLQTIEYENGTIVHPAPIFSYGILRDAGLYCWDSQAPLEWHNMNPTFNTSQPVLWVGENLGEFVGSGGGKYTGIHTVTETTKTTGTLTVTVSATAEEKLNLAGIIIQPNLALSWARQYTHTVGNADMYTARYEIFDNDGNDVIAQKVGIDLRFGTFFFQPYPSISKTSNPWEHNSIDYVPPTFPSFPYTTPGSIFSDISPQVIAQIRDESGIQEARVVFSMDGGITWDYRLLESQLGNPGTFVGNIPSQAHGTTVLWYLRAVDNEGNVAEKRNANNESFSYIVQNTPPMVQLLSPVVGVSYHGTCQITWSGMDIDGDSITYDLLYNGGGLAWSYIAQGLTGSSYDWDISQFAYCDAMLVKVIANDGLGGISEAGMPNNVAFTIDDLPTVSHPADLSFVEGELISASLTWTIDDEYPVGLTYQFFRNGQPVGPVKTWDGVSPATLDLSGYWVEGSYMFTIRVQEYEWIVTDNAYLMVVKAVNQPLPLVGGTDLSGQESYTDVSLGDSGLTIESVSTETPTETIITGGRWTSNPAGGAAPFEDMTATYFAIDSNNTENIVFGDPARPFVVTVPLPANFIVGTSTLAIMVWNETTMMWTDSGFDYTINIEDWTASVTIEHFSTFAVGVYSLEDIAAYYLGVLNPLIASEFNVTKAFVAGNLSWWARLFVQPVINCAEKKFTDAWAKFQEGKITCAVFKDIMSQVMTDIGTCVVDILNNFDIIEDDEADFLIPKLRSLTNHLALFAGFMVGTESSWAFARANNVANNLAAYVDDELPCQWSTFVLELNLHRLAYSMNGMIFLDAAQVSLNQSIAIVRGNVECLSAYVTSLVADGDLTSEQGDHLAAGLAEIDALLLDIA